MKKLISALLVTTLTVPVFAQDKPIKDVPAGDDKIVVVRKGDTVPFDGQLFDSSTALRWANWLKQYQLVLKIDGEYRDKLCKAQTDYNQKVIEAQEVRYKTVTLDYQSTVAKQQTEMMELRRSMDEPPFYKSVWFGVVIGVVMTGAAVGLGVYATK